MTSIIQCLANIKSLIKYLLKNENIIKFSSNKSKYKLTIAYIELLIMYFFEILHNELNEASNFIPFNQNVNQFNFNEVFQSFYQYFMNNYQSKISNLFYGIYNS